MNSITGELLTVTKEQTMFSTTIAKLTGKNHADVMRDIRKVIEDLGATRDQSKFALVSYLGKNGQQRPKYDLTYRETMLVVSGYSVKLRMTIIDRWIELENKVVKPLLEKQVAPTVYAVTTDPFDLFVRCHNVCTVIGFSLKRSTEITNFAIKLETGHDLLKFINIEAFNKSNAENIVDYEDELELDDYGLDDDDEDLKDAQLSVGSEEFYTVTELGKLLNPELTGVKFNLKLASLNLQSKLNGKWELTTKGKKYGKLVNSLIDGTNRKSIRWFESVLDLF